MNCPHGKGEYNKLLCKSTKFQNGDQLQTFANYVMQVRDSFDYTGQELKIAELSVAEFLQEARGNGQAYEMLLARAQTRIQSSTVGGGLTYFE
ncbi:hypothetical protein BGZ59_008441, partial [Podila verticillata]